MVCKNEGPPVITIFYFSPRGFFPAGIFFQKKSPGSVYQQTTLADKRSERLNYWQKYSVLGRLD